MKIRYSFCDCAPSECYIHILSLTIFLIFISGKLKSLDHHALVGEMQQSLKGQASLLCQFRVFSKVWLSLQYKYKKMSLSSFRKYLKILVLLTELGSLKLRAPSEGEEGVYILKRCTLCVDMLENEKKNDLKILKASHSVTDTDALT